MTGLLMIAAQCTVSGMASVYAEYILKKQQEVSNLNILTKVIHCLIFAVLLDTCFFGKKKKMIIIINIM